MKRTIIGMGTLLCALLVLVGCAKDESSTSGKKLLRVGMECAYAPFNWTQEDAALSNGKMALPIYGTDDYGYGYDVMMAEKIAEVLGYDGVEIHRSEWDSIGMGLDVGDYDCIIAGMSINPDREKVFTFTDTYYFRETVLTTTKDSKYAGVTSLQEFDGTDATITTQIGTAWVNLIPQIPGVKRVADYSTTAECFLAVSNKTADITIIDRPTTQSALLTNDDLVMLELTEGFDDSSTNVCIAVRKGETELQSELNRALKELSWDKPQMNAMMEDAIKLQPAAQ